MMRIALPIALVIAAVLNTSVQAVTVPANMQHFLVKLAEPKVPEESLMAKPKEYWRAGSTMGRVEEPLDSQHHMHLAMLLLPPDFWQMELIGKKATHITGGDKKDIHMPVFAGVPSENPQTASTIKSLEFGREFEFFKSHNAKKATKKNVAGQTIDQYVYPIDKFTFTLDADPKTNVPQRIAFTMGGKTMALQYLKYETVPFDPATFKPPAGMQITTVTADELRKQRAAEEEAMIKRLVEMHKHDAAAAKPGPAASTVDKKPGNGK